jgi:hypothetical protein
MLGRALSSFAGASRSCVAVVLVVASVGVGCGRSGLEDTVDSTGGAGGGGGTGGATGGSGGATAELSALCDRACVKISVCLSGLLTKESCVMQCLAGGTLSCPNMADIISKTDRCLTRATCAEIETCLATVPTCQ